MKYDSLLPENNLESQMDTEKSKEPLALPLTFIDSPESSLIVPLFTPQQQD